MDVLSCLYPSPTTKKENIVHSISTKNIVRPTADFPPGVWGDHFISYSSSPPALEKSGGRIEELKKEVKEMLKSFNQLAKKLSLIYDIQHLGLAYHFEEDIDELLEHVQNDDENTEEDFQIVTLRFLLLRQHGYNVSSEVFRKFTDDEGKFKQELSCDAKGLLYLYEASWLGTREEIILDEAMNFTKCHLKRVSAHVDSVLAAQIERALEMPFHHGMRRLEARHYYKSYQDDKSSNHVLLELAKLDFNSLQSLHQAEIKTISIWWRELGLSEKLSFARDRLVECYFWVSGGHFEPECSQGRMLMAKLVSLVMSVFDDMFDAYGTLEELKLFNDVIQRWDLLDADCLPEYMRAYLIFMRSLVKEIEDELGRIGRLSYMKYLTESIKRMAGGHFQEATWASMNYMPTLEEYLTVSRMSCAYPAIICSSYILMGEEVTVDVTKWLLEIPPVIETSSFLVRVLDDLVSTEFEQQRKHVPSSVQCCMNDNTMAEQEARAELAKMVADGWKDLNKEWLNSCPSTKSLCKLVLDYTRVAQVAYKYGDGYTDPSSDMKENISMLLLQQYD